VPRRRNGFTIIELLTAILIIGILAAVAMPKFGATRNKAKLASVKADVHAIQVAQEGHYSAYNRYGNLNQLTNRMKFVPSPGNTAAITGNARRYTATVTNASITMGPKECRVVYGGNATTEVPLTCT
jgi:prepilin-type N-terminal cleavage/methylation domain-containing protein